VSVKDDLASLQRAVRLAKVRVAIGVNERNVEASGTSIYNSLVYIDDEGNLAGKRRKLVPTGPERIVWAQGDGSTFEAWDSPIGKVGGLICWESYMPLARFAMYAWGVRVLLAPTWDKGEVWQASLRHIAKEGRVLVVGCAMALKKSDVPDRFAFKEKYLREAPEWLNSGESAIVSPDGTVIAGPVREKEEIVIVQIDEKDLSAPRWNLDVAGHYGRPDVFELIVRTDARPMVRVEASRPDRE
jgi:nitrilase